MKPGFFCILLACLAAALPANGRELLVGPSGQYKTIQQAIGQAQAGDVIKLLPSDAPYREVAVFNNKSGEAGKPIILDGGGATLDGSEPLRADEWEEVSPGLFRSTMLPERLKMGSSRLGRHFFVFDGAINRMGRVSKGKRAPWKAPAELAPGEWTYVETEKAFYLRLQEGSTLSSVRVPERSDGVSLRGNCEHLVIRNLTATHVWNDGFNIHGRSRDIRFENVRAIECGDDGISAHEDCRIEVDGLLSRGNATGFCHINQSQSQNRNIVIEDCAAYGVYVLDQSKNTLQDAIIRRSGVYVVRVSEEATLALENVLLEDAPPASQGVLVERGATLDAQRLSSWGVDWTVSRSIAQLRQSVLAGGAMKLDQPLLWRSDFNLWDMKNITWNGTKGDFAAYIAVSGQDAHSQQQKLNRSALPLTIAGADEKRLPAP